MMKVGTIKNINIAENRDDVEPRRLVDVQFEDPNDIQTVELYEGVGEDSGPMKGDKVLVIAVENSWKIAVGYNDLIERVSTSGQKRIYSRDSNGAVKSEIRLGEKLQFQGNGNNLVKWSELQQALTQFADFCNSVFVTDVVPGVAPNTWTGAKNGSLTLNISSAKTENIETGDSFDD